MDFEEYIGIVFCFKIFFIKLFDMFFYKSCFFFKYVYDIFLIFVMGCLSFYFCLIYFWYLNIEMI